MKIGILTFHRVYNYGAVIQAYSLQKFLAEKKYYSEIIDFSQPKQRDYTNIYSFRNGVKRFIKTIMLTGIIAKRIKRKQKFDLFFDNEMVLSKNRFIKESKLSVQSRGYDTFIVGSDQVWNVTKKSDTSTAYFLRFANEGKKRIAYAPSIGTATKEELAEYKNDLEKFNAISCREKGGAEILSSLVRRQVEMVLDPTLLVDIQDLLKLTIEIKEQPYILYYSLDGYDKRNNNMDILVALKRKFNLELKIITPEWPFHKKCGEDIIDAGPKEFLTFIRNAAMVCTNSFHGTALAIKFGKPFYVLERGNIRDERKRSLLEQLGIALRNIADVEDIKRIDTYAIDYSEVNNRLEQLRKLSSQYLCSALER